MSMIKIVVTGAGGQLGRELVEWSTNNAIIIGLERNQLDITNLSSCRKQFGLHRPDAVIHCAAYTAVDKAESVPDEAFRVNSMATRNIAIAAREVGAKLVYISTDYVFEGTSSIPYKEDDQTNPQTVYGKSKLAGEQAVQTLHDRFFIVRTSWVYGKYGNNFVHTMLRFAKERQRLLVVADQVGSPTYAHDLSAFLLELVATDCYGVYHASNQGACTWFEFAKAIFEISGSDVLVEPCTTAEFPGPAPRPAYSVMDHCAIRSNGLQLLRPWREALYNYLNGL